MLKCQTKKIQTHHCFQFVIEYCFESLGWSGYKDSSLSLVYKLHEDKVRPAVISAYIFVNNFVGHLRKGLICYLPSLVLKSSQLQPSKFLKNHGCNHCRSNLVSDFENDSKILFSEWPIVIHLVQEIPECAIVLAFRGGGEGELHSMVRGTCH